MSFSTFCQAGKGNLLLPVEDVQQVLLLQSRQLNEYAMRRMESRLIRQGKGSKKKKSND